MKSHNRDRSDRRHHRKKSLPPCQQLRLHPKALTVADQLHAREIVNELRETFVTASASAEELDDCTHFTLLDLRSIDELGQLDTSVQANWFWGELNLLLVLLARTSAKAALCSIDGIAWALGSRNELLLALSTRAILEHATALNFLADRVLSASDRLENVVWPNYRTDHEQLRVTDEDKKLREVLLRFAVGKVAELGEEPIPSIHDSSAAWEKFAKAMHDIPRHLKAFRFREMIEVMTRRPGWQVLDPIYKLLSEYCHPNAASRTLDFDVRMNEQGKHRLVVPPDSETSVGFMRIVDLGRIVIPMACEAIRSGIAVLSKARMPMPKELFGARLPTELSRRFVDPHGRVSWVHLRKIADRRPKVKATLTARQRERIEALYNAFVRGCDDPVEKWLDDIACEGPYVEEELATWEHLASVFQQEMQERGTMSDEDCRWLYYAVVESSNAPSVGDLLASAPMFRAIPNLERIVDRVISRK